MATALLYHAFNRSNLLRAVIVLSWRATQIWQDIMLTFIKRIFTWWNGATFGTLLAMRKAEKIATDDYGNTYFQERKVGYEGRKRRYVTYKGYADASRIPPEWHGWLHHMYDEPPSETPLKTQSWELPHHPNLTGTVYAYRPKGSLEGSGQRDKITADYEAWTPDD